MKIPIPEELVLSDEAMESGLVELPVEFSINMEEGTMTPISVDGFALPEEAPMDEEAPMEPGMEGGAPPMDPEMGIDQYVASQLPPSTGGGGML
jgi:hypothetical protein